MHVGALCWEMCAALGFLDCGLLCDSERFGSCLPRFGSCLPVAGEDERGVSWDHDCRSKGVHGFSRVSGCLAAVRWGIRVRGLRREQGDMERLGDLG